MKHFRRAILGPIIIGAVTLGPILFGTAFSQSGWRSTITGITLPLTTARIADASIVVAAAKALETVARENNLSGRCRGTEIIQYTGENRDAFIDQIEQNLTTQGFNLENLPGGDGNSYNLAARQGGKLIILNFNLIEDGRTLIAWCALEPIIQQITPAPTPNPPKLTPPNNLPTGRYACQYTLASGNLIRPGNIQIVSSNLYRFGDDRTAYTYTYNPRNGRILWRNGPLANPITHQESRLELNTSGRPHILISVRTTTGSFKWDCLRQA